MKIGYIAKHDLELNPQLSKRFEFKEASFTRRISSRGDTIRSKLLRMPVDYQEIVNNANFMKNQTGIMLIREPFLLDDELRERCIRWVAWANSVDPSEYELL